MSKKKFKGEAKSDLSRRNASDGEVGPKRHHKNKPFGLKLFWEFELGNTKDGHVRIWRGSIKHWYASERDRETAFDMFDKKNFLGKKEYTRIEKIERS